MIEVLPRYETHFILLRKVHNRPGVAATNIYIDAKDYSDRIVEELRKEFESRSRARL